MLEPLNSVYNFVTARLLWSTGKIAAGISIMEAMPADAFGGFSRNVARAEAYAALDRFADAADTLLLITGNQVSRRSVEDAVQLLRTAQTKTTAPETLPRLEGALSFVYAYVGALDRVMEFPGAETELHRWQGAPRRDQQAGRWLSSPASGQRRTRGTVLVEGGQDRSLVDLSARQKAPARRDGGAGKQDGSHRLGRHEQRGKVPARGSSGIIRRAMAPQACEGRNA